MNTGYRGRKREEKKSHSAQASRPKSKHSATHTVPSPILLLIDSLIGLHTIKRLKHSNQRRTKMAIKPKDLKFEEAALRKRIDFVRNLKLALQNRESITAQTVHIYTLIIDGTLQT